MVTVAYQFDGQYDPVKRKRRKKIAIDPRWDGLTRDAAQARNAWHLSWHPGTLPPHPLQGAVKSARRLPIRFSSSPSMLPPPEQR